jgi:DNA-binding beta-propeller fold protein YncE
MNAPYGLAVDEVANKLYIAALTSNTVFVLDRASGIMETFAGSPYSRGTTIASTAKASLLSSPQGLFFDAANNYLYIAGKLYFLLLTSRRFR